VLCEHAFFLFEKPDRLICELKRVLKKGAPLVISAQNRYIQALSSIPDKPNLSNVEEAFKLLSDQKHACMAKDNQVNVYTWSPLELREMLERNGLRVEKVVGKCVTMPLRIKGDVYTKTKFSEDLLDEILKVEYAMCEKPDALALAGHIQATAFKP
jgi:SAM-dependent methyltransferase